MPELCFPQLEAREGAAGGESGRGRGAGLPQMGCATDWIIPSDTSQDCPSVLRGIYPETENPKELLGLGRGLEDKGG